MLLTYQELLSDALTKAQELGDESLCAILQLAETDKKFHPLLQPPTQGNGPDIPAGLTDQREFICPKLYQASMSGSIDQVEDLLGPSAESSTSRNIGQPNGAAVVNISNEQDTTNKLYEWAGRLHGPGLCTLHEVTTKKNTVLHVAAEQGHIELIKEICRRDNSLLLSENSRSETPLQCAARAGHSHIVSLIILLAQQYGIGRGVEVLGKKNVDGDNALHEAARHGHQKVAQVLMTVAPNLSSETNHASMSPLYLAVVRKSVDVVKALLQYQHPSTVGPKQQNVLHAAVLRSLEITSMLLKWRPALAHEKDFFGSTPMHFAASDDDIEIIKLLLRKAPLTVYMRDSEGSSPLHVAARMDHSVVLHEMIKVCPDSVEIHDNQGRNFLHIAANLVNKRSVVNLVVTNTNLERMVHERDNNGNTPFHAAARKGCWGTIFLFLRKNKRLDLTTMNNDGQTPLDLMASLNSFFYMIRTLVTLSAYGAMFSPQRQDRLTRWKGNLFKWVDRTSESLSVIAVLVAAIAYSATFNVPGAYDSSGLANLRKTRQYKAFIIFDTIALVTSIVATVFLVVARAVYKRCAWVSFSIAMVCLWLSIPTMGLAFVSAAFVVMGNNSTIIERTIWFISIFPFCLMMWALYIFASPAPLVAMVRFLVHDDERKKTKRQIAIQFSNVGFFIRLLTWFIGLNFVFMIIANIIVSTF